VRVSPSPVDDEPRRGGVLQASPGPAVPIHPQGIGIGIGWRLHVRRAQSSSSQDKSSFDNRACFLIQERTPSRCFSYWLLVRTLLHS
jgi:hypothetical protein